MIWKIKAGQKIRFGINLFVSEKMIPREYGLIICFPVDLLPKEEYIPEFDFPFPRIGRRLKVAAFKFTFRFATWERPVGKQLDVITAQETFTKEKRK